LVVAGASAADRVTLRRRRRGASWRDAGDKLPASGRPGLSRETGARRRRAGGMTDSTGYYLVDARGRAHQSNDRTGRSQRALAMTSS